MTTSLINHIIRYLDLDFVIFDLSIVQCYVYMHFITCIVECIVNGNKVSTESERYEEFDFGYPLAIHTLTFVKPWD